MVRTRTIPPGPYVTPGSTVTWTYTVTNTGEADLSNVSVVDDQIGGITCPSTTSRSVRQ